MNLIYDQKYDKISWNARNNLIFEFVISYINLKIRNIYQIKTKSKALSRSPLFYRGIVTVDCHAKYINQVNWKLLV